MSNLVLVFVTGLTAGGLSCLAVQGGMLASSLKGEADDDVTQRPAQPIALFLASKLAAYTIMGFALGWLGSLLQLTPMMRAVLMVAIGLFMIATALRLLKVHPFFRHFVIEPPKSVTRFIRQKTKQADDHWFAPVFLGALTVLIPCGVTQAMMALAVASGSPLTGGLIMFAFTLGTTPLFFTLAYLATKLGARWQAKFWKATGAVVLVLGLLAVDGGLTLAGSPLSSTSVKQAWVQSQEEARAEADRSVRAAAASADNALTMTLTDTAYSPAIMEAKAGMPIKLTVNTNNTQGCARSFAIPSMNVQKLFAETDSQTLLIPPQIAGSTIRLTCVMGMYTSQIVVK